MQVLLKLLLFSILLFIFLISWNYFYKRQNYIIKCACTKKQKYKLRNNQTIDLLYYKCNTYFI